MPTAVLGDRAAGKTTFIGLLYAAQVKYTDEPSNRDIFRFYAAPSALNIISRTYTELVEGRWPDATLKGQTTTLSFLFGYKKTMATLIPRWVQKKNWMNPFAIIGFGIYDVAGEDITDMIRTPDGRQTENFTDAAKKVLESRTLVFLIDASRITTQARSKEHHDMLNYDGTMATLVSLVAQYNSKKDDPAERKIYPVIVFTKFDKVDRNVLIKMNLKEPYPPPLRDGKRRTEFAEKIMTNFFPQTLALLKGGSLMNVSFDNTAYFFTDVNTVFGDDGFPSPALSVVPGGVGHELDYSYSEFEGFITHFKKIADEMPDEIKEDEEIKPNK